MKVLVSGQYRSLPAAWWQQMEGPKPPPDFANNGCSYSPDYVSYYEVWPACVLHDYGYSGATGLSRREVDAIFRRNLRTILRLQGCPWLRAWWISLLYWRGVRRFGAAHYRG